MDPRSRTYPDGMKRIWGAITGHRHRNGWSSEAKGSHTTIFKRRPGERIGGTLNELGENLLPPIVVDAIRRSGWRNGRGEMAVAKASMAMRAR